MEKDAILGTVDDIFFWTYFVILVAGTTMTAVFLLALMRGRKMLAQWPFYKIVWSMTWLDAIYLAVQLFWKFPQMVAEDHGNIDDNVTIESSEADSTTAVTFLLDVFNLIPRKGILYFSLLMSLNRLTVFVKSFISPIFTKLLSIFRDYVGWTTAACWAFILTLSVYTKLLTPASKFNRTLLKFEPSGTAIIDSPFLKELNKASDYVIPFVIVGIYIVVYIAIGKKRKLVKSSWTNSTSTSTTSLRLRRPDDRNLLYQAIIITFFLQLDNVTRMLNVIDGNGWLKYLINILDLITAVLNHSIHATIFLIFNPTIRKLLPRPTLTEIRRRLRCS